MKKKESGPESERKWEKESDDKNRVDTEFDHRGSSGSPPGGIRKTRNKALKSVEKNRFQGKIRTESWIKSKIFGTEPDSLPPEGARREEGETETWKKGVRGIQRQEGGKNGSSPPRKGNQGGGRKNAGGIVGTDSCAQKG